MNYFYTIVSIILLSLNVNANLNFNINSTEGDNSLRIVDPIGLALEDITVQIGSAPGNPFNGNIQKTNSDGIATFPSQWEVKTPIFLSGDGFVPSKLYWQTNENQVYTLSPQDGKDSLEVSGKTLGYKNLRRDGKVDFSIVMPAIKKHQILQFDLSMIISPKVDVLKIIGKEFEVPSNLSIPKQRESYLFTITLNKPKFRTYTRKKGAHNLIALHGQFPFKKVIDHIRSGQSLFDAVNMFTFLDAGQTITNVDQNIDQEDIEIGRLKFDQELEYTAPKYSQENILMTMSIAEKNGWFYPTDLKKLTSEETRSFKFPKDIEESYVLSLLSPDTKPSVSIEGKFSVLSTESKDKTSTKLSFIFSKVSNKDKSQFLDYFESPTLDKNQLRMLPPREIDGIFPTATYITFNKVQTIINGKVPTEIKTRLWESISNSWVDSIDVPDLQLTHEESISYRWEVMYIGSKYGPQTSVISSSESIENITHVSRNSLTVK